MEATLTPTRAVDLSLGVRSDLAEKTLRAQEALLRLQEKEGYWWFTLEANESIGAGFIQLIHFLGEVDREVEAGLAGRILSEQRPDGSWSLFFEGPPDLSTTVECYLALRLAGHAPTEPPLQKAREVILKLGGLGKVRVFTRIHLALFGLLPWSESPSMPPWLIFLPVWSGFSIYEFSSWARASIVPLLVVLDKKPIVPIPFSLDELKSGNPPSPPLLDRILKALDHLPWHPGREKALSACERWIREHIERTEDIYPAMAYAAMAMKAFGYSNSDPTIRKALTGLKKFRHDYDSDLTPVGAHRDAPLQKEVRSHQQCCISPLWDTPWAGVALLESGLPPDDPSLIAAAHYLIERQITDFKGDWRFKNPDGEPGGWAFEFQNDFFPDIDDTIQILQFLRAVGLPAEEKDLSLERGFAWLLSMQSRNGGWAAFDKNNVSQWVNKIPFSDHGACLDPPTPDVTGRALELLTSHRFRGKEKALRRAVEFLVRTQEEFGAWRGRWGVNYLYGTWCVLTGLASAGIDPKTREVSLAVRWLKSIQSPDGGWGESCLSDREGCYVPLGTSIPSQTAWAVMALVASGEKDSESCQAGHEFLLSNQNSKGLWEERHFTGTGFPGHFYIRYHGYRCYFPLLALAKYSKASHL